MNKNTYQSGISVLICTYNGAKRLPKTLENLSKQDFQLPFEIILVDNASKDNTAKIAMDTWKKLSLNTDRLQVLYEAKPGKINALNLGLQTVKYKYVLICDDDNWLALDFLSQAFNMMEKNPLIGILGGKGEAVFEHNASPEWFEEVKSKYAVGHQGQEGKLQIGGSVYGAGSVMRKEAYDKLLNRGYQPILTGRKGNKLLSGTDIELCLALQILEYEIHYDSNLTFKHFMTSDRLTPTYFEKLSDGMIYPSFILYTYGFVIRNIPYSWLSYWLLAFYLITKHTFSFVAAFAINKLTKKSRQKQLSDYHRYQIFWHFFSCSKTFLEHWKLIKQLKR